MAGAGRYLGHGIAFERDLQRPANFYVSVVKRWHVAVGSEIAPHLLEVAFALKAPWRLAWVLGRLSGGASGNRFRKVDPRNVVRLQLVRFHRN